MGNRSHRYQQRSYKHREQERIPENFLGEDQYYDFDDCYPRRRTRYLDFSDCESVDSHTKYKKHNTSKIINNNSHASVTAVKNRYAVLDMEESSLYALLCEDNEQQGSTYPGREVKEDEGEAGVYRKNWSPWFKERRQHWIDSWSKKDNCRDKKYTYRSIYSDEDDDEFLYSDEDEDEFWVINVDGFFRKNRKAGYGVMIRNRYGVPILASASVYEQGKPVSWIYHALQGIVRGLELAIKYEFRKVYLFYTLPHAMDRIIRNILRSRWLQEDGAACDCENRKPDLTFNIVCERCLRNNCKGRDEFNLVYPLIQEIVHKCYTFYDSDPKHYRFHSTGLYCRNIKRKYNIPADYLAKLQVNKKEMKPDEFSEELKDILYEEADIIESIGTHRWRRSIFKCPGCL